MPMYNVNNAGFTPTAASTSLGLTASATTIDRVVEWFLGGEATSSTVNRMGVARSTTVGTTPTAVTPALLNPRSAAAGFAGFSTFSTQPAFATVALATLAFNAFGGVVRWVAAPGEEMYVVGGTAADTQISLRSISGAGVMSADVKVEEL